VSASADVPVAIALGSNLGDRDELLHAAVDALREVVDGIRASSWHRTEPVGVPGTQPEFLNGAIAGTTRLSARDLLEFLLATERRFGRERPYPGAARTLDLDLILYGDQVIDEPGLVVPHPRFRERLFVLAPLSEIAAERIDPVTGRSVADLLRTIG
jgi:2-amino-4-hydroxy-6-hydroxymethyldihydropteridine diphosphokinase